MKTKALLSSALAAILSITGASISYAQSLALTNDVPKTISYQGILTDNNGTPLPDGTYTITLSLYADPSGSLKLWQDSYDANLSKGLFNLYLGDGHAPLPDPATMNTPLWVGTQVGDSPLMYPLTPLSASPYALNVPDRAITTGKLANGSVTAEKMNTNYIAGVQINDQQIAGTGTVLKLRGSDAITLDYDATTNSVIFGANNTADKATVGDDEKGSSVLDNTDGSENWLGRNTGANQPSFGTPVGTYNTLAGGYLNTIQTGTDYSTIVSGRLNSIASNLEDGAIVGGSSNEINLNGSNGFIGSGYANIVSETYGTIAGGRDNEITGIYGFIGGGLSNKVDAAKGAIGGGEFNDMTGQYGAIAGGYLNLLYAQYGAIGGGTGNQTQGNYSAIPGGDNLLTTGYAHSAVGFYNAPRGALASQPSTGVKSLINDPLFMVGNGTPPIAGLPVTRSNAFEVSYNGHSVVYDVNGQTWAGGRVPIKGATYVDNIIYAWGDVTSGGSLYSDFGVVSITHTAFTGVYDVRIDVRDPVTGAPVILTRGSVTATLTELDESTPCAFIHASRIGAYAQNQFRVRIRDASCQPLDAHFMFKVTGRP